MAQWLGTVVLAAVLGVGTGLAEAQAVGTYSGEVWVWDSQRSIVTLRQGTQTIRVRVAPGEMVGVRPHDRVTVRGELLPPGDIERTTVATRIVGPRDPADEIVVRGTVAVVDPSGRIAVNIPGGRILVWTASPGTSLFHHGDRVRVQLRVQTLAVDASPGPPWTPAPVVPQPGVAGEYAAVVGTVSAVDPAGRITVSSDRGPVEVPVLSLARYKPGDFVEVRSAVQHAE